MRLVATQARFWVKLAKGRFCNPQSLSAPDPVLDPGVAAVAALEGCGVEVKRTRVRVKHVCRNPPPVEQAELSTKGEDASRRENDVGVSPSRQIHEIL